eukprot:TRINITY_DN91871_c0_g1_i1.p1 TRINITY_DN91871_c0_g1~~TRINITY_DN91871_c0_g1_i1.p1  ORF type:complete len:701 (+),score=187.75 TRINITY_DN91871_c0_g1_i1:109-2211(+)
MVAIEELKEEPSLEAGWSKVDDPQVFKSVRLRKRVVTPTAASGGGYPAEAVGAAAVGSTGYNPRYGPIHRSHCRVEWKLPGRSQPQVIEFRLGDCSGYSVPRPNEDHSSQHWSPPLPTRSVDVPEWLTEAVLSLDVGQTAEFKADGEHNSDDDKIGPVGCWQVKLLSATKTEDLLGNGTIVVRELVSTAGEKPANFGRVRVSYRVWFVRSGELVVDVTGGKDAGAGEGDAKSKLGREIVLDDTCIMSALEIAIKSMTCGSRAVILIAEEWGQGALTPDGNPFLSGAAVWADMTLHSVQNELQPGAHESVDEALEYALDKKQKGNECLATQKKFELGKAVRRYEAGIQVLEGVLPECSGGSSSSRSAPKDSRKGPMVTDEQRPPVEAALTALQLNCAQACLKRSQPAEAEKHCSSVLKRDDENVKAHYRRGLARIELDNFSGAHEDLKVAVHLAPQDAAIRKELVRVDGLIKEQRNKEKQAFGGFYEKEIRKDEIRAQREEKKQKQEGEKKAKEEEERDLRQLRAHREMKMKSEEAKARLGAREAAEAEEEEKGEDKQAAAAEQEDAEKTIQSGFLNKEGASLGPLPKQPPKKEMPPEVQKILDAQEKQNAQPFHGTPESERPRDGVKKLSEEVDRCGADFAPKPLVVGAEDQKLVERVEKGDVTAPTLPQNLKSRKQEEAPPVEYEVPSFLKRKAKKAAK